MKVSGWAGYPLIETKMSEISWPEDVEHILFSPSLTVRGCGRSYGDSALGKISLQPDGLIELIISIIKRYSESLCWHKY